jgi:hypothetical protein
MPRQRVAAELVQRDDRDVEVPGTDASPGRPAVGDIAVGDTASVILRR